MTIDVLIDEFLKGATEGVNGTGKLKIEGNKLIHYETVLLEKFDETYILNYSRYSRTTGVLQNKLKDKIKNYEYKLVTKIPRGYSGSLSDKLEEGEYDK